ncbi:hypothetical protein [Micromonospora eburnea]|uniref:Metallo-beta-lactamase superfamily protein n=1 Tax=Micromonospora eburnea TaxID=227316 RepID=A0A1C6UIK9_9ACTN|nr:hypothetical protein [Micromonospora eburnea]SCL53794.1 hypothetical protein GA0070604_2855 [Micromonospora eburnea]
MSTGDAATPGTYAVRAAHVGTLPVPGWEVYFGRNDTTFHDLAFYVWLVTDGERVGLVDLGLPADPADRSALVTACQDVDPRSLFRDTRGLAAAMRELAVQPEDVDFVCVTQTVTYHTGGLDLSLLPRAQVYLAAAGVLEMLTDPPGHPSPDLYFTATGWSALRELAVAGRLTLARDAVEVAPGIVFEPTGGHHPGSAAVRVRTADGTLGLLETAFLQGNVDGIIPVGISEDAARCREVIRRYRAECDEVIALHDPVHLARFGDARRSEEPARAA